MTAPNFPVRTLFAEVVAVVLSELFLLHVLPVSWPVLLGFQSVLAFFAWTKWASQAKPRWEPTAAQNARENASDGCGAKPTDRVVKQEPVAAGDLQLEIQQHVREALRELGPPIQTNPFTNRTAVISEFERVRLAILSATLLPIRMVVLVVLLMALFLVCKISIRGLSDEQLKAAPLKGWRRTLMLDVAGRITRTMLFLVMGFLYVPWTGRPAPRSEASIVVCNHRNFVDPLYVGGIFMPSAVGAREHLLAPIVGTIIRASQAITVDRMSANSKLEVASAIKDVATSAEPWPHVLLFPEGTTCNGAALIRFMKGAFAPGVPVQPIIISYTDADFDQSWVPGIDGLPLLLRIISRPVNTMHCAFLPVYHPSAEEKADPILYASNVRRVMAQAQQVPTTDHTFEDALLAHHGALFRFHSDATFNVEMARVKKVIKSDLRGAKGLLQHFAGQSELRDGRVDQSRYSRLLQLETDDSEALVEAAFNATDEQGVGSASFRSFMAVFGALKDRLTDDCQAEILFSVLDSTARGSLTAVRAAADIAKFSEAAVEKPVKDVFPSEKLSKEQWLQFARENRDRTRAWFGLLFGGNLRE